MIVSLMNPAAAELSVWIGDLGCFHPISLSAFLSGIISLAVMYSPASSASAADAITNLMIWEIVRTGLFEYTVMSNSLMSTAMMFEYVEPR